jgi:hypothetical protein
VDFDEEG